MTFTTVGQFLDGGITQDELTLKGVHVCCEGCEKALRDLFKGSEVTFEGKGSQKDVKIKGKALSWANAMNALNKAGFAAQ